MQYERPRRPVGKIIGCRVKSGKRHRHHDPVLIRIGPVDKYDNDSHHQEKQQQAPRLPYLDKELAQVFLDKYTSDDKGQE